MQKEFIVYIKMAKSNRMSLGISNNMKSFMNGKAGLNDSDNAGSIKIVYYEIKKSKRQAIAREKELKMLNRKKLNTLVRYHNPDLLDLSKTWIEENTFFTQNVLFLT
jgi:predicted GIY-YIG superfamily endonuclease